MATTRLYTVEDVEKSPPEGEWELIDGELIPVSPTSWRSNTTTHRIGRIIGNYVDDHDLGAVTSPEGGFVLFPDRETLLAPDVGFVRKNRIPPVEEQDHFPRLAPDLAVEVLSPTDRASTVVLRMQMYKEAGVPLIWLVNPEQVTVTVIAAGNPMEILKKSDTLVGRDILPGFSIRVATLIGK